MRRRTAFVDDAGEWFDAAPDGGYNAVEYYTRSVPNAASFFIGFIERSDHVPALTRIAFRVAAAREWPAQLHDVGACNVESSEDMTAYPAVFFEDPAGTRLEVVSRRP